MDPRCSRWVAFSSPKRIGIDLRGLVNALTLDKAVHGIVETGGVNRNRYVRSATGNQASCLIRGKQGRWIAPARDRSAR